MKRVFIKTYGCQMNVYDSSRMMDILNAEGYTETDAPEKADLVLLNTCHIREKASEKMYSDIGRLDVMKKERAAEGVDVKIGVAGCVAQAEGKEILRRASAVDLVVGPQSYHRLPHLLRQKGRAIETEFPLEDKFDQMPAVTQRIGLTKPVTSFLTVQEGCDKFCTFCVVPYTRGAEFSRPAAKIIDEAKLLADKGVREFTLLGQNVNAYHGIGTDGTEWNLGRLLFALAEIPQIKRLRYMTSHPRDMHEDLYTAHRDLPQVMPYLNLPVQSGSDKILKAMNRQHTAADYLKIIERLKNDCPDLALSSDFIVGFPSETDDDFRDTLQLVETVGYASSFTFSYSPRPGTPAASMEQLPENLKMERLHALQALLMKQQTAFKESLRGKTLDVLFEKTGRFEGQLGGRTPYLQPIHADAPAEMMGQVVQVIVTDVGTNSLSGTLVSKQPQPAALAEANI
ncbi:MAG: tRNA (N6-isopentenyl adenosine(37)-C2)-methylthiotransferase MiaB [Pseudomonadota bacterium]